MSFYIGGNPRLYDISPDGQHFVMIRGEGEAEPTEFKVVQNWFQELKRLVPTNSRMPLSSTRSVSQPLARVLIHLPQPNQDSILYYGHYTRRRRIKSPIVRDGRYSKKVSRTLPTFVAP